MTLSFWKNLQIRGGFVLRSHLLQRAFLRLFSAVLPLYHLSLLSSSSITLPVPLLPRRAEPVLGSLFCSSASHNYLVNSLTSICQMPEWVHLRGRKKSKYNLLVVYTGRLNLFSWKLKGSGDRKESGRETSWGGSGWEVLTGSGCGGRSLLFRGPDENVSTRWGGQPLPAFPLLEPWMALDISKAYFCFQNNICAFNNVVCLPQLGNNVYFYESRCSLLTVYVCLEMFSGCSWVCACVRVCVYVCCYKFLERRESSLVF